MIEFRYSLNHGALGYQGGENHGDWGWGLGPNHGALGYQGEANHAPQYPLRRGESLRSCGNSTRCWQIVSMTSGWTSGEMIREGDRWVGATRIHEKCCMVQTPGK